MPIQIKNVLTSLLFVSALAGCAAMTPSPTGGMKMDASMCKKMMEGKGCGCCQMMQNMDSMRTSGMMTGDMPMMNCKADVMGNKKMSDKKPKVLDAVDHEAH